MMDLAVEKGVTLVRGSATAIERENGQVTGVRYDDPSDDSSKVIPATHVVLSAGAWSPGIQGGDMGEAPGMFSASGSPWWRAHR